MINRVRLLLRYDEMQHWESLDVELLLEMRIGTQLAAVYVHFELFFYCRNYQTVFFLKRSTILAVFVSE